MFERFPEFFEGAGNRLSMTRLMVFLSFWPASYVLIKQQTETMLGLYLGAYVLGYVGGKGFDARSNPQALEAGATGDNAPDGAVSRPLPDKPSVASGDKPKHCCKRKGGKKGRSRPN